MTDAAEDAVLAAILFDEMNRLPPLKLTLADLRVQHARIRTLLVAAQRSEAGLLF